MKKQFTTHNVLATAIMLFALLNLGTGYVFAQSIIGTSSVPCNGTGSYNWSSGSSSCQAVFWTVTRPNGSGFSSGGGSVAVNWGSTPGIGTVSASSYCCEYNPQTQKYDRFCGTRYRTFYVQVGSGTAATPSLSGPSLLCFGASGSYTASNTGDSYTWTVPSGWRINGSTTSPRTTTSRTVTITAPSSSSASSGNISVRANLNCGASSSNRTRTIRTGPQTPTLSGPGRNMCPGSYGSFYTTALSGASYQWFLPSGWSAFGSLNASSISVTAGSSPGSVGVRVTVCGSSRITWKYISFNCGGGGGGGPIYARTGPEAEQTEALFTELSLFPNPANDLLNVEIPGNVEGKVLTIYNVLQQAVMRVAVTEPRMTIDLSSLKEGMYMIQVNGNGENTTKRVLIQR